MASYSVTRSVGGNVFGLYFGRVRERAQAAYDKAEPGERETITLTEHRDAQRLAVRKVGEGFTWEGRCPCSCAQHPEGGCGCPCPRHPLTTNHPDRPAEPCAWSHR